MMGITLKDVKIQFNKKKVMTPAEKLETSLRKKFGAYCRVIMRNSIKAASGRNQHSRAGQPPLHHNGPINLKETIFFVDDPKAKEVVIGAVLLSGKPSGDQALPGKLERGGVIVFAGRMARFHKTPVDLQARPYAQPAFDKAIKKKLPDLIKGGVMREV